MSFIFRLDKLLKIREHERDQLASNVQNTLSLLSQAESGQSQIDREIEELQNHLRQMRTGVLPAESLRLRDEHRSQLERQRKQLEQRKQNLEKQLDIDRQHHASANCEVDQIELLKQREFQAYTAERQRIEKRKYADVIAARSARGHNI